MFVIVSDRNRLTKYEAAKMNAIIHTATGEECVQVQVNDYADAVRVFTLATTKPISMDEIRQLLRPPNTLMRHLREWWHSRKAVNA